MPPNGSYHNQNHSHVGHWSGPIHRPLLYLKRAGAAASYPIRGIWFFGRNREFWPLFVSRILPLSLMSFLVYLVLFTFTFLPQYAFLAIFHGWGAWVNAVVLVLGEGLVIIQGLFEGFFVDECRVDVFDVSHITLKQLSSVAGSLTASRQLSSSLDTKISSRHSESSSWTRQTRLGCLENPPLMPYTRRGAWSKSSSSLSSCR